MTPLLKDFLDILNRAENKWGKKWYQHVDPCGLIPLWQSWNFAYESTPKNTTTIAETEGDGVHFGILLNHENTKELQPIVMTVPMMSLNVIIAETLEEFLGIGYYNGWSGSACI